MGKQKRRDLAALRNTPQNSPPAPPSAAYLQQVSVFSGPLPKPEDLIRYNEAFPTCAERIVGMAEQQAGHRQDLERRVVDHNISHDHRGQTLGFTLSLVGILCGVALVWLGSPKEGLTIFFSTLTTLVGMFVYSRVQQKGELNRKAQPFQPSGKPK
jgi:uncharacterized membrane protein